ncbi:hypothetical protein N0V88_007790 [Collariella sp. IMI 366227]|nr:hypothetical protein N0V88_007790 [Collariella sp. IMI 366227]
MTAMQETPRAKDADPGVQNGVKQAGGDTTDSSSRLQAWLVVFGAWCAMIPSMGLLNTLAVLQAWVSEHQLSGMSASTTGWIFSTFSFFVFFCGAQIGPIFDAYDIRLLTIPGSIGVVVALICMSFSTEFYQFLLSFGVLGGISASLQFYPSVSAVSHWFLRRRSLATGIAFTSGGLGGVAFPLIILYLAPDIGFAWSIRILALISLVTGGLACILLKKRLPPNKIKGGAIDLKALVVDSRYAIVTLAVFLAEFAVLIPYTYISSYAIDKGMDAQAAYRLNAFLNVGAIPGRVLPNYFADRYGVFNTMIVVSVACTVVVLGFWLPIGSNDAAITAFTVVYGFWSGASISLTPVCIGEVCGTEDFGKRNGTSFFIASFAALISAPIAGAILGNGGYQGVIILSGLRLTSI